MSILQQHPTPSHVHMRISGLPTLQYTDCKVVFAACRVTNHNIYTRMSADLYARFTEVTGLNKRAIQRAMSNLRKSLS